MTEPKARNPRVCSSCGRPLSKTKNKRRVITRLVEYLSSESIDAINTIEQKDGQINAEDLEMELDLDQTEKFSQTVRELFDNGLESTAGSLQTNQLWGQTSSEHIHRSVNQLSKSCFGR